MTDTQQGSTDELRGEMAERAAEPQQVGMTIEQELRSLRPEFEKALPPGDLSPVRFERTVITELRKKPDLRTTERASLLGAVMTAAQLGLEFPLDQAYLVPFKDHGVRKTQLIIGYKGYIALARRSGEIKDIIAREIHEKDDYDVWSDEDGDHMIHRPYKGKDHKSTDRGDIVRYFGRVRYTNGGVLIQDLSMEDIMSRAKRSASFTSSRSPWKSDFDSMCRKTVIRVMVPFLPLDASVAAFVGADEQVVRRMPDATLVRDYPDAPDLDAADDDDGIIEGQVISHGPERAEAEATLDRMITTLPDRRDQNEAGKWLMDNYGSIPNLTDDQLAKATVALDAWLDATPATKQPDLPAEATESTPTAPEGTPPPQPPTEAPSEAPAAPQAVKPDTDSQGHEVSPAQVAKTAGADQVDAEVLAQAVEVASGLPAEAVAQATRAVEDMSDRSVNRALATRQIPTRGSVPSRRQLLIAHLAKDAAAAEAEAVEQFDPTQGDDAS